MEAIVCNRMESKISRSVREWSGMAIYDLQRLSMNSAIYIPSNVQQISAFNIQNKIFIGEVIDPETEGSFSAF